MLDKHSDENRKCKHNLIGGGKVNLSYSTICMRLCTLLKPVCGAAIFMGLFLFSVGCQQATLIPDEEVEAKEGTRGEEGEAPSDSTTVKPEFDVNNWGEGINADFEFGGTPQEGGEE